MRIAFVLIVFILFIALFKKAAGTLNVTKINIVSFIFYSILVFQLIGGSLIFLGIKNHYLIKRILDVDSIDKTYYILVYTVLMLPLTIYLCNRYIDNKRKVKSEYNRFLDERVCIKSNENDRVFKIVLILTIICVISMIYVFYHIGYIPLFKMFSGNIDLNVERINISRNFTGNEYIKNLIMLILTPLLSYLSYIYMKTTKEKRWIIIFITTFILSIFVKTYNFEKAPIIYYIVYFILLDIIIGRKIKLKNLLFVGSIVGAIIFMFYYVISGYSGDIFSLTSGPMGRILMTQVATLFLHVDAFPNVIPFLNGQSFPGIFSLIIGASALGTRSGRMVMLVYGQENVRKGIAGVMNTIFVGEAYANYGLFGVAIAPIVVGIIVSMVFNFAIKSKKTPLNLMIYFQCFVSVVTMIQGGFIDFFYNVGLIFSLAVLLLIYIYAEQDKIIGYIRRGKKICD